jgi:hypothetical protein
MEVSTIESLTLTTKTNLGLYAQIRGNHQRGGGNNEIKAMGILKGLIPYLHGG